MTQNPHAALTKRLVNAVNACTDDSSLARMGESLATDTPDGRVFRSLPKPTQAHVREALCIRRNVLTVIVAWTIIWRSFCEAVQRGTQVQEYITERALPAMPQLNPLAIPREGYQVGPAYAAPQAPVKAANVAPVEAGSVLNLAEGLSRKPAKRAPLAPLRGTQFGRDFVACTFRPGQDAVYSWITARASAQYKRVSVSHSAVVRALATIGRVNIEPTLKSEVAQFGRVMGILNNNGMVSRQADTWPKDVMSRYIVGPVDTSTNDSLGDKVMIADLTRAGELRFPLCTREDFRAQVEADYQNRVENDLYTQGDIAAWVEEVLYKHHEARECGPQVYIPAPHVDAVKELLRAIRPIIDPRRKPMLVTVANPEEIADGMAEGFCNTAMALLKRFNDNTARAIEGKGTGITLASAEGMLDDVAEQYRLCNSFEAFVPGDHMTPARDALMTLEEALRARIIDLASSKAA